MNQINNKHCLNHFGLYIKEAREIKGLTQIDMATSLGIRQSYYSMIEKGKRNVDLVLALKICHELNINMSEFISDYL